MMTISEIYTRYRYLISGYAKNINVHNSDDIVGDWLFDMAKRGQKHVDTLLYKDSGKVNFVVLKKSIYQSWYDRHGRKAKPDTCQIDRLQTPPAYQMSIIDTYSMLTDKERDVVRYILTSGRDGMLPNINDRTEILNSISMKLFGKVPRYGVSPRKVCIKCGKMKPISEFHVNSKSRDGHSSYCKECVSNNYKRRHRKD